MELSREDAKSKTALRMKYEAEAKVLAVRFGGLEGARQALGLSQRKMAQLLLVDPSAWTRWVAKEHEKPGILGAPPHVYRALAWFLATQEKFPAMDHAYWLRDIANSSIQSKRTESSADFGTWNSDLKEMKEKIRTLEAKASAGPGRQRVWENPSVSTLLIAFGVVFMFGAATSWLLLFLLSRV